MDIAYLLFLQNLRTITCGIFDSAFLYITTLGEDFTLMVWVCGIYWCVDKAAGIYLMFNFHIANFANQLIKITACVYRPWIRDKRVIPLEAAKGAATGYSFPSGHTAKAVGVWGGLAERMKTFKPVSYTHLRLSEQFKYEFLLKMKSEFESARENGYLDSEWISLEERKEIDEIIDYTDVYYQKTCKNN